MKPSQTAGNTTLRNAAKVQRLAFTTNGKGLEEQLRKKARGGILVGEGVFGLKSKIP